MSDLGATCLACGWHLNGGVPVLSDALHRHREEHDQDEFPVNENGETEIFQFDPLILRQEDE